MDCNGHRQRKLIFFVSNYPNPVLQLTRLWGPSTSSGVSIMGLRQSRAYLTKSKSAQNEEECSRQNACLSLVGYAFIPHIFVATLWFFILLLYNVHSSQYAGIQTKGLSSGGTYPRIGMTFARDWIS